MHSRTPLFLVSASLLLVATALPGGGKVETIDTSLAGRDTNGDGVNDLVEALLGLDPSAAAEPEAAAPPYASFQTPTGYLPENDLKTGAVIVYSPENDRIRTWREKGYVVQTMYGFRTGNDYIKAHPDEGQTDSAGKILDCGPGSYYMVPTQSRIDAALAYFREAIGNGTSAVCPEEPEFFARAGYSESFKREWQAYYGEPWVDQTASVEARWKSERLKAYLEWRMVKSILEDAEKRNPNVVRMVACHSPVSYYSWGIIYPHWQTLQIPQLQEVIGQVWTGTARSACKYEGISRERTFENGFLEYSSLYNQVRGTGKRLWFLMDPLEDNPDRTMEDYDTNYELTLAASLMFPEVDAFEVLPWPTRIFGRVPSGFATKITTIIQALQDVHNQKESSPDAGTAGIATFTADSMGWQRGAPSPSNMDCFYGLTLPLLMKGIPVQVIQLERVGEPGYLDPHRALLLTYDILKPLDASYHTALADWVKKGGVLVFFGGSDAYNALPEWWRKQGFTAPQEHLFAQLGLKLSEPKTAPAESAAYRTVLEADAQYRNLENKKVYEVDLSEWARGNDTVFVRFADKFPDEGWGPFLVEASLEVDGREVVRLKPGGEMERRYLADDSGSFVREGNRFADGWAYWVYRFPVAKGKKAALKLEIGNQLLVQVGTGDAAGPRRFTRHRDNALTAQVPGFQVPRGMAVTSYSTAADAIYRTDVDGKAFFEHEAGKGKLVFCGIAPSFFSTSAEAAGVLRAIVRYSCGVAGLKYREQGHLAVRRGRYLAVRTLDGAYSAEGRWIDLLDPSLPLIGRKSLPPWDVAFLADVSDRAGNAPGLLFCSAKVEKLIEEPARTCVFESGPAKVTCAARFWTAGKKLSGFDAFDAAGAGAHLEVEEQGDTVLVRHENSPGGVIVRLFWE